jgi:hypothetical protein
VRPDMFKVIVERPRSGSRMRPGDARQFWNSQDTPSHLGMKRGHPSRKWLNENLAPLRRYLVSQAGRPWNSVFSEICAAIDTRSTVKQHVRSHIADFVAIDTKLIDGKVYGSNHGWRGRAHTPLCDLTEPLYVHPVSGLLMCNQERITWKEHVRRQAKRKQAEIDARRRILSPLEQLHRVDGLWYYVRLGRLSAPRKGVVIVQGQRRPCITYETRWDVLRKAHVSMRDITNGPVLYGERGLYAVSKRQLGSRELRRYGLRR